MMTPPSGPAMALIATSPTSFRLAEREGLTINFEGGGGTIQRLVATIGNTPQVWTRVATPPAGALPAAPSAPPPAVADPTAEINPPPDRCAQRPAPRENAPETARQGALSNGTSNAAELRLKARFRIPMRARGWGNAFSC